MSHDHDNEVHQQPTGYGVYFLTFFALIFLTAVTVTVAGLDLGRVSVAVAVIIAMTKATVVLNFFMHLKYESRIFHILLLITIVTLGIFIGLTFTDILFR